MFITFSMLQKNRICEKLKSVVVPDSVKEFGDLALGYTLDDKKMAAKKIKVK